MSRPPVFLLFFYYPLLLTPACPLHRLPATPCLPSSPLTCSPCIPHSVTPLSLPPPPLFTCPPPLYLPSFTCPPCMAHSFTCPPCMAPALPAPPCMAHSFTCPPPLYLLPPAAPLTLRQGGEKLLRLLLGSKSRPVPLLLSNAKVCSQHDYGKRDGCVAQCIERLAMDLPICPTDAAPPPPPTPGQSPDSAWGGAGGEAAAAALVASLSCANCDVAQWGEPFPPGMHGAEVAEVQGWQVMAQHYGIPHIR